MYAHSVLTSRQRKIKLKEERLVVAKLDEKKEKRKIHPQILYILFISNCVILSKKMGKIEREEQK